MTRKPFFHVDWVYFAASSSSRATCWSSRHGAIFWDWFKIRRLLHAWWISMLRGYCTKLQKRMIMFTHVFWFSIMEKLVQDCLQLTKSIVKHGVLILCFRGFFRFSCGPIPTSNNANLFQQKLFVLKFEIHKLTFLPNLSIWMASKPRYAHLSPIIESAEFQAEKCLRFAN